MTRQPFTCHDCGDTFQPTDDTCATGYAVEQLVDADGTHERKICYDCARKNELTNAAETGKLFAYVNGHYATGEWRRYQRPFYVDNVTTWPGLQLNVGRPLTANTWRSNFGDTRTAFTCQLPTGVVNAKEYPATEELPPRPLETWHGIAFAGNGGYCRLYRNKVQS